MRLKNTDVSFTISEMPRDNYQNLSQDDIAMNNIKEEDIN